jgi:diguanylate cyclase (GGDEF)-like protein/PAS domain S-box-containing protein
MTFVHSLWRRKIEIAFVSATLILLVTGVASYVALAGSRKSSGFVDHTYRVISAVDDLVIALSQVQSSSRSYALSGETAYLDLHSAALARVSQAEARTKYLTRDNVEQQELFPQLERVADRNNQSASTLIKVRQTAGPEDIIDVLRRVEGAKVMDEFRGLAATFKNRELKLLQRREQRSGIDFARTQMLLALGTLLGLVITVSAGLGTLRDLRRRKKAEADLYLEKELAQVTLASIGDAVLRADVDGNITFVNRAAAELTGWSQEEAIGKPFSEVFTVLDGATRRPIESRVHTALREDRKVHLPETALLLRRDGAEIAIEDTVSPIHGRDGKIAGAVKVFRDVSAAREAKQILQHSAQHDPLTGLPNRILLHDRIERAIASAQRRQSGVAVLYLDLDGFKLVNDTRGHAIGDELLRAIAGRLCSCVRDCDTVARIGGDEFVILLTDISGPQDAEMTARRVLKALARAHSLGGTDLHILASIGISVYNQDAGSGAMLLANADAAMYEAKSSGRRQYVFYPASAEVVLKGASTA